MSWKTQEVRDHVMSAPMLRASVISCVWYCDWDQNICFASGMENRYQSNQYPLSWIVVKYILCYLRSTKDDLTTSWLYWLWHCVRRGFEFVEIQLRVCLRRGGDSYWSNKQNCFAGSNTHTVMVTMCKRLYDSGSSFGTWSQETTKKERHVETGNII